MDKPQHVVRRLLNVVGTTHVAKAGIRMNDKPIPAAALVRVSPDDDVRQRVAG